MTRERTKVIDAYKGYVRALKLQPYDAKKANEATYHRATFQFFDSEEGLLQLFVHPLSHDNVLTLLERLFPSQIDRNLSSQRLMESITSWIEAGHSENDIPALETYANAFIDEIESNTKDRDIYVPLYGIDLDNIPPIEIGNCTLIKNTGDPVLQKVLEEKADKENYDLPEEFVEAVQKSPAFFKVKTSGHHKRSILNAETEARISSNILMLFIGSYYYDRFRNSTHPRALFIASGKSPKDEKVFLSTYQDEHSGNTQLGGQIEYLHNQPYEIKEAQLKLFEQLHLHKINNMMREISLGTAAQVTKRLFLAISWFGKGTTASSVAESYMCNAISIESLLTQGRTHQQSYAHEISALATRGDSRTLFPHPQLLSKKFADQLLREKSVIGRREVIRKKAIELLKYRNLIAHGHIAYDKCEPLMQLDFEALVRSCILSFIDGGWQTLPDFKKWANSRKSRASTLRTIFRRVAGIFVEGRS